MSLLIGLVIGAAAGFAAAEWRRKRRDLDREVLFAFAAHELASPTTGILLALRNLVGGLFGEVPADQRRWLEVSLDQVAWLGGLAADVGDLAHLELGGRLKVMHGEFDPKPVVDRVVGDVRRLAERW